MIILNFDNENARDPDVVYHEGKYYCLYSYKDALWIKSSDKIEGLLNAEAKKVYAPDPNSDYRVRIWAPELHFLNNEWHIYVTIGDVNSKVQHMFVLRNHSTNPMDEYEQVAYLNNGDDKWAIDGTVIKKDNELYYVYSSFGKYEDGAYQALYIVKMKDPYHIELPRKLLSKSEYDWERRGCEGDKRPYVNEGPFAVYHNNKIHIVYSASGCWTDYYCLGLLTFKGGDMLDANNWEKHPLPILDNSHGYVGPGHASFIQNAPDNKEYCFFHSYEIDCSRGEWFVLGHAATVKWENDIPKIEEM